MINCVTKHEFSKKKIRANYAAHIVKFDALPDKSAESRINDEMPVEKLLRCRDMVKCLLKCGHEFSKLRSSFGSACALGIQSDDDVKQRVRVIILSCAIFCRRPRKSLNIHSYADGFVYDEGHVLAADRENAGGCAPRAIIGICICQG